MPHPVFVKIYSEFHGFVEDSVNGMLVNMLSHLSTEVRSGCHAPQTVSLPMKGF